MRVWVRVNRRVALIGGGAALVLVVAVVALASGAGGHAKHVATADTEPSIIIGTPDVVPTAPGETVLAEDPDAAGPGVATGPNGQHLSPAPEVGSAGLLPPDGKPWRPPIPFTSATAGRRGTVFILVIGSDARPGSSLSRSNADSIHIVAVDADGGRGTIVGLPRDSWVEIPGHGTRKINSALALGGPDLLAETVTRRTGIRIDYYVLTGFNGLKAMVDQLGGVDVEVTRRMNDPHSGSRFDRGWHWFHGDEALAFSRDRHSVALGDFSRSENQGALLLAALAKFRAEVGEDGALRRWVDVLTGQTQLDISLQELLALGVTARNLEPGRMANVVASGRVGTAGGASVVFLDEAADALFADVAPDAVIDAVAPPPTTSTTTTTTTAPPTTLPTTTSTTPVTLLPSTTTTTTPTTSTSRPPRTTTTTTTTSP
jgi:LCP family protein required for cell wall assembly